MDPNLQSPTQDNVHVKPEFRKPTTDAANRKYRRHSPIGRSPSDGSPKRDRSASPKLSGEDPGRVHENRRRDDGREVDRDSYRSHSGRVSDGYRHSDRQFYRSSHRYSRNDDYIKHDKHADEEERYNHHRLSSRSGRESGGGSHYDHSRSRDHLRDGDRYSRDKYDHTGYRSKDRERETSFSEYHKYKDKDSSFDKAGSGKRHPHPEDVERERRSMDKDGQDDKKNFHRSTGDYEGDPSLQQEEFKEHRFESSSRNRAKDSYKNDIKGIAEQSREKSVLGSENQESPSKRQKFSSEKHTDGGKKVSKFSTVADVKDSSPKQPAEHKIAGDQVNASDFANDVNAAKVAAMKAAELVNKNLVGGVGTGFMTADQKKKLLWGNKKTTTVEESGHRWDTAQFSDRERQEKFNKLMSLRLPWCLWPIVGCEGRSKSRSQTRKSRWRRPSSRREAEGTPARFREAIHRRAAEKRWPYCWTRSLSICFEKFRSLFLDFLICSLFISLTCTRIMLLVVTYFSPVKHKLMLLASQLLLKIGSYIIF